MKLIDEWKGAWRLFTVQIGGLAVAWSALPAETQAATLKVVGLTEAQLPGVLGIMVIVARVLAQPKKPTSGGDA